jgi:hypothetical protein
MKSQRRTRDGLALVSVSLVLATAASAAPATKRMYQVPTSPAAGQLKVEHFPTALGAFEQILRTPARVVAFGEYHQTTSTTAIRSALARFTDEILPALARSASDLVVETWVSTGACGAKEAKVDSDVQATTQRPAKTESEIVTMLKRSKAVGMEPHILTMSCKDYRYVTGARGETDFGRLLKLTRQRLQSEVSRYLAEPPARAGQDHRIVAVYGGALHNDLYPTAADRRYTFGPALSAAVKGQYLEVDLLVPEYIATDRRLANQPWFRLIEQQQNGRDTLLIRRGERSFAIVFPPSKPSDTKPEEEGSKP